MTTNPKCSAGRLLCEIQIFLNVVITTCRRSKLFTLVDGFQYTPYIKAVIICV